MTTEKMYMLQAMATPGYQLLMARLQAVADAMQAEYDRVDVITEPGRIMHIQVTRDVIQNAIPRIMEEIVNQDELPEKPRWTFFGWLRSLSLWGRK